MDVILCLTHDCQLRCSYCYSGEKKKQAMSFDTACRAIDIAFDVPHKVKTGPIKIAFFGGEPLLEWKVLKQSMLYARERQRQLNKPIQFAVTTNGLALSNERLEFLKDQNCFLCFSFDGSLAAQNACRRFPNGNSSFEQTEKSLLRSLAFFPDLDLVAVVSPENVQFLNESIDHLLELGVRNLILNPDFYSKWTDEALSLWRKGYEYAGKMFLRRFREGKPCYINFITIKILTKVRGGYDEENMCDFGITYLAVAPSGNIYPCQRVVCDDRDTNVLMGNVLSGVMIEKQNLYAQCRGKCNRECDECVLKRRCRNWCSCVNYALTGDISKTPGIVCFHERMAIEIADTVASELFAEKNPQFMNTFYLEDTRVSDWA